MSESTRPGSSRPARSRARLASARNSSERCRRSEAPPRVMRHFLKSIALPLLGNQPIVGFLLIRYPVQAGEDARPRFGEPLVHAAATFGLKRVPGAGAFGGKESLIVAPRLPNYAATAHSVPMVMHVAVAAATAVRTGPGEAKAGLAFMAFAPGDVEGSSRPDSVCAATAGTVDTGSSDASVMTGSCWAPRSRAA